jgi:hypothetical protein
MYLSAPWGALVNLLWAAFRAAVNHAIDERNKEARRTRAAEQIAAELRRYNDNQEWWAGSSAPDERKP